MKRSGTQAVKPEQSGFDKLKTGMAKADHIIDLVGTWIFRLRKIVMAAPVVYYAIRLAAYNGSHLPDTDPASLLRIPQAEHHTL